MQYWNTSALFSTKLILIEPLGSTKSPEIGSRIFHIKFIILPAVLPVHLQLNHVLKHARPQLSWFFKFIVHYNQLPLLESK